MIYVLLFVGGTHRGRINTIRGGHNLGTDTVWRGMDTYLKRGVDKQANYGKLGGADTYKNQLWLHKFCRWTDQPTDPKSEV